MPYSKTVDLGNVSLDSIWANQPRQIKAKTPKKKKGFWEDQISTGGGIAGALAGASLGATAGSVVPIVGTAAGGIIGALLGGSIGGAGGQVAENYITGEKDLGKDVASEALWNGVFGAGPIRLGSLAVRGGAGLAKGAGKTALKQAGEKALLDRPIRNSLTKTFMGSTPYASSQPLKMSFAGKMNAMGDKALASQYGTIGKPIARSAKPLETIGQLADWGIKKPKDAERIADSITGSNGILTKTVAKALKGTTPISSTGLKGVLQKSITENGLVDKDAKSVRNIINSQLKVIKQSGNSPQTVLKVMRNLEKRSANLQGKGGNYRMSTPERTDQANVLLAVKNELQDRLYNQGGGNQNLSTVLTPKLRDKLLSLQPGNKQWQEYVDKSIMGATDIKNLRSAQAPFVRIKNIIEEGDVNALTFGGRMGNNQWNGGTVANTVINTLTDNLKNPAARAISTPLRSLGKVGTVEQSGKATLSPLGVAGRLATAGVINSDGYQSTGPNSLDKSMMTNAATNSMPNITSISNMPQPYQNTDQMSSEPMFGDFSKSQIETAMTLAMMNGDQDAFGQLKTIYDLLPQDSAANLSQSSKNAMASSDNAINTIDQLEGLFTNAGGGSGRIGGALQGVAANAGFDENARIYNSLSQASVTQIAKALAGSGAGTVSDMDAKVIIAALPTLMDTPAEARAKFAALRQRLEEARNNTLLYGAGDTVDPTAQYQQQAY